MSQGIIQDIFKMSQLAQEKIFLKDGRKMCSLLKSVKVGVRACYVWFSKR